MPKDSCRFFPFHFGAWPRPGIRPCSLPDQGRPSFPTQSIEAGGGRRYRALPKSHRGPIIQGCEVHDEGRWYRRNNEISNSQGNPPRSLALGIRCYFRVSREVTRAFSRFRRKAKLNKGSVECRQSKSRTIDGNARISSKATDRERTVTSAPK
mgnify:CR=1 FL=1